MSSTNNIKIHMICAINITLLPPAMTVYNTLVDLGYRVCVLSDGHNDIIPDFCSLNVNYRSYSEKSIFSKYTLYKRVKNAVCEYIDKNYQKGDIIYFIGNPTMKFIPETIIGKDYILHFLEFQDDIYLFKKMKLFKIPIDTYCNNARCVVACEENRAFLMSVKWNLNKVPKVLPNKPYQKNEISRNSYISNDAAREAVNTVYGKKIILYQGRQGNLKNERNLDCFYEAIDELGDDYIFAVMSPKEDNAQDAVKGHNAICFPFISPPYHLEVTSHAFIGVATYSPVGDFYQGINVLYCAPNKIYEYSMFGIPMLTNRIPGLLGTVGAFNAGICCELNKKSIVEGILAIKDNYDEMSQNSYQFFDSVDVKKILKDILECQ